MGTKRPAKPAAPIARQPVDPHGLAAALRLFVDRFVVDDKRRQVETRLLTAERRDETLATLARWLASPAVPLEGAARSPAGLAARFGELLGVQLDDGGAGRTTIAGALEHGRGRRSLFIGDTGRVVMITRDDGPPLLATRL